MLSEAQVIVEWHQRRLATWRAIRVWIFVAIVFLVPLVYATKAPTITMASFLILAPSFLIVFFAVAIVGMHINEFYRCPRCNSVPKDVGVLGLSRGIAFNPDRCSSCSARLKDNA